MRKFLELLGLLTIFSIVILMILYLVIAYTNFLIIDFRNISDIIYF